MARDKAHQRAPIRITSVLYPCPSPRLDEVNKMSGLVVVLVCEVNVIYLFTVLVNAPVFSVEVDDAIFVGPLIDLQTRQMAQRLDVSISDVSPP